MNVTGAEAVAQDANFFKKVFCINSNEFNWYPKGTAYTSLSQIPNYSRTSPNPTSVGPISVSLAADNPAAGTLVKSQAAADLAHFQFSGNSVVNSIVLKRIGVSADTDLVNVYLYDGVRRLTDSATVTNGTISFNDSSATGLFSVSGARTISVRADLSSNSGETVGVQLTSVNGGAVSVTGNLFTVANATLATVVMANSATPSGTPSYDPASDIVVWQDTATVGTRYVNLRSLQLRVVGSAQVGDLQNFRLYVDGVQAGAAVSQQDTNGYVVFDIPATAKMETGGRVLKVLADIVNGSSRNFTISLRQAADVQAIDSQYNQNVLATVNTGTFPDSAGTVTINSGTLTITKKTDSAAGDVVRGASGVSLGKFEFKAAGERMKVESLNVTFTAKDSTAANIVNLAALRNGALFANGVQIGSTQTIFEDSAAASNSAGTSYTQYSLGSSLIVNPGTPVTVEIKADIYDNNGLDNTTAGNSVQVSFANGSSNVQRLTSLGFISCVGGTGCSTTALGNTLTIRTGSLTTGKYTGFANQSYVSPSTGVKLAHFTLAAASSEDVNVNTINLDSDTSGGTFTSAMLSDVYVRVLNDAGGVVYTSPTKSTLSTSASNSYSVNFSLPKTKTYQIEVWGNIISGITNTHSMNLEMDAAGVTAASSTAATGSEVDGQTLTAAAGVLTKANGVLQPATLARGGDTKNTYSFTLTPAFDNFTLDEVYVDLSSTTASSTGAVAQLLLKDGNGATIGAATVSPTTGSASFTGINFSLPQSGGIKTFKVDVQLANVGVGANDTYGNVTLRLDGLKFRDSAGNITTQTGYAPASFGGNEVRAVAGYPVFENQALSSSVLSTGAKDIFQTKISSVGTGVTLKRVIFSVTTTNGPIIGTTGVNNLTNGTYKIFKDGVDITSLGTIATGSADLHAAAAARTGAVAFTFTNEEALEAAGHVYKLQVNVTATGSTPQSITTQIANNSTTSSAPEDTANTTLVPVVPLVTSPSVVWTDSSTLSHSATTDDWMNDFLIKTLNVSQSISL
ncbi:MAG: hypothetical protein KW806_00075 [Candidatus Yanofskybacteria bacterium]|nr:hypothetical protein [Candidatus Yanofskybacteria bacterium]